MDGYLAMGFGFRRAALGLVVALVCVHSDAFGQTAARPAALPEIKYGYPEQPPRVFTNKDGQPDGHYPRLLKIVFARAGMDWQGASYPAKRLMNNLDSGVTNFSILVRNPVLDTCCLYGGKPVWNDELRVYSLGSVPRIRAKEDLVGKTIITLAGFSYGGLIDFITDPRNNIHNNPANSHLAAFQMLDAGRADYLLDYAEPAAAEGLARHPIKNLQSDVLDVVNMYFVISRNYPGAAGVLERLESIYEAMRKEDVKREYTK